MFEFLRKTPTVVGLDISSTAVKLLELSQDKGQYRVESYGVEVIPENAIVEKNITDIDAVGGAIKRVRQKSKTLVKEVGVAVAGSSVITKTLELAASLSEAQIEEQLLDDADKYIPYPLDEVAMDFQVRRDHDPEGELVNATVGLTVTPQITPDDRIILQLNVTNNSRGDPTADGPPAIYTESIQTEVIVDDGETAVLGGLYQTRTDLIQQKTPVLGDLPVLGRLFRNSARTNDKDELLIFITPRIIREGVGVR